MGEFLGQFHLKRSKSSDDRKRYVTVLSRDGHGKSSKRTNYCTTVLFLVQANIVVKF
jgi:hypothetical protein